MKSIEINSGSACNNDCRFCMVDHEGKGLVDFATIKKELIKARKQGFAAVGFLGGEFTLHPDILKIIKLCRLLKFKNIHIISNGRKYEDRDFVSKLVSNGVNRFSVSIHSHLPEIEDNLTQRPGGWMQKINGLKNLVTTGLPISVNFVINRLNYQDLEASLNYFINLGINDFRLNFIWLHGQAAKNKDLFLTFSEALPYLEKVFKSSDSKNFTLAIEGIPACILGIENNVKFLGEDRDADTQVVAFNNPDKIREEFNWQARKANEFKIKHPNCRVCKINDKCEGVWRDYINLYGWSEFKF